MHTPVRWIQTVTRTTGSQDVAQAGLKLLTLMPPLPKDCHLVGWRFQVHYAHMETLFKTPI